MVRWNGTGQGGGGGDGRHPRTVARGQGTAQALSVGLLSNQNELHSLSCQLLIISEN